MSSRLTSVLIVAAAVLASSACKPQNATLTSGSYTAFLSLSTSANFVEGKIHQEDLQDSWIWDCRILFDEDDRPEGADMSLCDADNGGVKVTRGSTPDRIRHETWANNGGFMGIREDLDPWRGEGVITSENDFQVTFHHRVSDTDFRFAFVIDPSFQPTECQDDGAGGIANNPIDGDWLDGWSRAMTEPNYEGGEVKWTGKSSEGTLFMLNAGSYQVDPDSLPNADTIGYWSLPPKMEAGFARARFGAEEMFGEQARYGEPYLYTTFNPRSTEPFDRDWLYFVELDPEQFGGGNFEQEVRSYNPFRNMMTRAEQIADQTREEISAVYPSGVTGDSYEPAVVSNAWRKPDGFTGGFDGWGEMHYSWVRIDQDRTEIVAGADISGEFSIWFYGANSQSRVLVQGEFEVDNVKKDRWTTPNVNEDKLEENGTTLCVGNSAE
jgi:hypothetical protein